MMRVPWYCLSSSDQTYQARSGEPRGALRARWNQGCWSLVWLTTSSAMTRMPRACAAATSCSTSSSVP